MLVIFAVLVTEYAYQTYLRRHTLTASAFAVWYDRRFKTFCLAIGAAYIFILVRCAYRIPELIGGWGGELMRIELEFIILEGAMISLAVACQTIFHPGKYFPAITGKTCYAHQKIKGVEDTEMEPLSNYEDIRPAGRYEEMRAAGGHAGSHTTGEA